MTSTIYQIRSKAGDHYVLFESVIDQFLETPLPLNKFLKANGFKAEDIYIDRVLDLRPAQLQEIKTSLEALGRGETLTDDACVQMADFERFLEGTVAWHQYHYPEIESRMKSSIEELGLNAVFPDDSGVHETVTDHAMYPAFQNAAHVIRYPKLDRHDPPTPEQNKLAARFVTELASVTGVLDPDATDPTDIVTKFNYSTLGEAPR